MTAPCNNIIKREALPERTDRAGGPLRGVVVETEYSALDIARFLIQERSAWYELTPLPDDEWEIVYKAEHHAAVRQRFGMRPHVYGESVERPAAGIIDPNVCPRCGSYCTECLGSPDPAERNSISYRCNKCAEADPDCNCDYVVEFCDFIDYVYWQDDDGAEHGVQDSRFLAMKAAEKLVEACKEAIGPLTAYSNSGRMRPEHCNEDGYCKALAMIVEALRDAGEEV